ncbi:type II secretion system protein GspD [Prolixibacter denitrificans]|nr:secretin N-terminal domain-containing protein [Prolixibacter denitrificans]
MNLRQRFLLLLPLMSLVLILIARPVSAVGQTENTPVIHLLDSLSNKIPALNENIDITVNATPVQEFLRGVANQTGLNINIDPTLNFTVTNNFVHVRVRDILQFLVDNYDINLQAAGNIINIRKNRPAPTPLSDRLQIEVDTSSHHVNMSIEQVPIQDLAKEITRKTGNNIVVTPELSKKVISSYIQNMPLTDAMDKLGMENNFTVTKTDGGFYVWEPKQPVRANEMQQHRSSGRNSIGDGTIDIEALTKDSVKIHTANAPLDKVVEKLFDVCHQPYKLLGPLTDNVSIDYDRISFASLIDELFAGTDATFKIVDGRYWIGKRNIDALQDVKMIQLKYRTVDSLVQIIPLQLKTGVEIKEYPDINSIILSGPQERVNRLATFIHQVDKLIPVILIEVLIIDNKNSKALATGITAGLSDEPVTTKGTVFPSVDMTLSSKAINNLIDGLNGFGWVNLGKVKSNFYMTLKALEEDGVIDLRSTPQLSTLNGHKATMSIGNTEYYKEEMNTIYGSINTQSQVATTYKPVNAELAVTIRPIVAGNDEVTLDIKVEQSDFTSRISEYAPPGKVSRKFESLIRVKDQEMILLGGLEEKEVKDTRSGLPLLARIPIIRWFFSSREKSNTKSKLNLFIKPTIIK